MTLLHEAQEMRFLGLLLLLVLVGCGSKQPSAAPIGDLRDQDESKLCTSRTKVLRLPDRTFTLGGALGRLSLTAVGELRLDERLLGRLDEEGCFRDANGRVLAEWGQTQMLWMREPHPYLHVADEPRRVTWIGKGGFRGQTLIEAGRIRGAYDQGRWTVLGAEPQKDPELALRLQVLHEMWDASCDHEPFLQLPGEDIVVEHESGARIELRSDGTLSQAGLVLGRLDSRGCFFDPLGNWAARWTEDGRLIQRGDASFGYTRFRLEGMTLKTYLGEQMRETLRFDGKRVLSRQGSVRFRLLAPAEPLSRSEAATLLRVALMPDLLRLSGQRGPGALGDPEKL